MRQILYQALHKEDPPVLPVEDVFKSQLKARLPFPPSPSSIDPNVKARLFPLIDPNVKARLFPSIDPNVKARLFPSIDPNVKARLPSFKAGNLPGCLLPGFKYKATGNSWRQQA
ncbi:hypothetical protein AOXY_G16801 [Acipenser oxyrinchus oxyrinchus]|uniref:Uncharacterized protein n=1 Tax=Acipenser oxyrinchus oxyrinchus TaxID=40147 RepID=A0AAD8D6D2_ACIOX|nr:hypothetical protein AOXY_G16801 [Acipenser oxyrinchus oxyrinchus]